MATSMLTETPEVNGPDYLRVPAVGYAADTHNIASGNDSWYSPSNLINSLENTPKFWGLALASGATGILNTGIALGNWVSEKTGGGQLTTEINLKNWVSEYDNDLGEYYRKNTDSIDTWGFVATSLIPGTAGVKALNMGQKALKTAAETGVIGQNLARATGLLAPASEVHIARAATQLAATNQRFSLLQADTLRAIGTGFGKHALEAAAFETAVLATSYKSPFFENMDAADIAINAAIGIGLGSVIGGALSIPGVKRGVKNQVTELDKAGRQGIMQVEVPSALPKSMQAANHFLNREGAESFLAKAEAGIQPGQVLPDGLNAEIITNNIANAKNTVRDINNRIRTNVHELVQHKAVANEFADIITAMPSREGANLMVGAESLMRVGDAPATTLPRTIGQRTLDLFTPGANTADVLTDSASTGIQWNKIWGNGAGQVFDELPKVAQLADTVKLGAKESIKDGVDRVARSFGHSARRAVDALDPERNLTDIQSRYLWAARSELSNPQRVMSSDIAHLEAAFNNFDAVKRVEIVDKAGEVVGSFTNKKDLQDAIISTKQVQAAEALKGGMPIEEVAERLNISPGRLTGLAQSTDVADDFFYKQAMARQMELPDTAALFYKPSFMGVKQGKLGGDALSDLAMDAEVIIAANKKAAQITIDNAVEEAGRYLGQMQIMDQATGGIARTNHTAALPDVKTVEQAVLDTNRFGSGSRLFSFANGNYGSAEAVFQNIGNIKRKMDIDGQSVVREQFNSSLSQLRVNTAAATEVSVINERLASMPIRFGLDTQSQRLIPLQHLDDIRNGRELSKLPDGVPNEIRVADSVAFETIAKHIQLNGQRINGKTTLRAAQGLENQVSPEAYYPIKPDPRTTPYFAFVVDNSITGAGKTTMVHARNSSTLEEMIRKVTSEFPEYNIVRKDQSEAYHKALGNFEYDKTLHDNYIDTRLASKGINSQFLPQTDGNLIANKFQDWHLRQVRAFNSDLITTKYEGAFRELESLGKTFGGLSESRYSDMSELAGGAKNNPYVEYAKTALNVSNISEYPWLTNANQYLDSAVSNVWNTATAALQRIKGVSAGELDEVNKVFADHGFRTAYYDAATSLLANHPAGTNKLSQFIRGANSLLATTFLRLDWVNAINNKVGSVILTSTELRHVVDGIKRADAESVGKLAALSDVKVPGTGDSILSAPKLVMKAMGNFWGPQGKELIAQYEQKGWISSLAQQASGVLDDLTLRGTETGAQLTGKLAKAFETTKKLVAVGEKATGNKLVEDLNRFMAADIMRQVTDIAVDAGVMSAREVDSYINTFVNRTQVNLNAAQRPLAFQGPIGMAMGLFQSYQFNMMQQLFRYVAPGRAKDAAFLMGMQGSMYGLNGLPGFQAFNEHIIGQAAGNHGHNDIVQSINGAAGYDLANFFLYGMPSNLLRANLYTRGDLTPQHPTILPSSIADVPFVSMYSKFLGNIKNVASNVSGGGNVWESFLNGVEHNSINRPLAGLAQTLRGLRNGNVYSTAADGDILSSNDLLSIATLARLAGGKPMDESIIRDEKYRISMYKQADLQRRASASQALRTSFADSGEASAGQLDKMFNIYLETGGKAAQFNKFIMGQYTKANTSTAEKLRNSLSDPYSVRMQLLMGGAEDNGVNFNVLN